MDQRLSQKLLCMTNQTFFWWSSYAEHLGSLQGGSNGKKEVGDGLLFKKQKPNLRGTPLSRPLACRLAFTVFLPGYLWWRSWVLSTRDQPFVMRSVMPPVHHTEWKAIPLQRCQLKTCLVGLVVYLLGTGPSLTGKKKCFSISLPGRLSRNTGEWALFDLSANSESLGLDTWSR